ncbi:UDP binding domain-containing protein, partial [Vibrio parahaemolyticus]
KKLGGCKGKTIGIWGLSFKPNTDDFRDSRSLKIIAKLLEKGALIKAHDPITIPAARKEITSIIYASNEYEAIVSADALVIATDWPQYAKADL